MGVIWEILEEAEGWKSGTKAADHSVLRCRAPRCSDRQAIHLSKVPRYISWRRPGSAQPPVTLLGCLTNEILFSVPPAKGICLYTSVRKSVRHCSQKSASCSSDRPYLFPVSYAGSRLQAPELEALHSYLDTPAFQVHDFNPVKSTNLRHAVVNRQKPCHPLLRLESFGFPSRSGVELGSTPSDALSDARWVTFQQCGTCKRFTLTYRCRLLWPSQVFTSSLHTMFSMHPLALCLTLMSA